MTMQEISAARKLSNGVEWHPEHDDVLREHWGKLTTSQIGVRIGRSKSAVIGRAHRLGLERLRQGATLVERWSDDMLAMTLQLWVAGVPASEIARQLTDTFGMPRTADAVYHKVGRGFRRVRVPRFQSAPPPRADKIAAEDARIPLEQRRTLLELTCRTCRWPVGDPGNSDFFFCGAEPLDGRPYCGFHHSVAHQRESHGPRPNFVFVKRKGHWSTERALYLLHDEENAA